MKSLFVVILLVTLSACGEQAAAPPPETPTPIAVPPTLVPTATSIFIIIAPSPLPEQTQPIPTAITADSIQVERWQEYENALAEALFPLSFNDYEFMCEWEILGRSNQEVYVWTVCMTIASDASTGRPSLHSTMPVVIHIQADGSVESVEIPRGGNDYAADIRQMFPPDAQERYFEGLIHFQELTDHVHWRREHPEDPPLIVLSSISTLIPVIVTPLPTEPTIPILTPDAVQVERWKEYEDELAKLVLSDSGAEFPLYKDALCEWDILGQADNEVYVWAQCFVPGTGGRGPALIYVETDGSIRNVRYAFPSSSRDVIIRKLFPADVQAKIYLYFSSEKSQEMGRHLMYRLTHPEEPPLIVLDATPTP